MAHAFNGTINETQARLCPNGTCVEAPVADFIHMTDLTGIVNGMLNNSEVMDIINNTMSDFANATGANMTGPQYVLGNAGNATDIALAAD